LNASGLIEESHLITLPSMFTNNLRGSSTRLAALSGLTAK